ncbi:hypothetical protein QQ045_011317 [Rhodiola kirilowii]
MLKSFWRRIWRLKVQPKVKIFAWRVYHNFLPSADNLDRRQCSVELECQICGWRRETTVHTSLQCWWAKAYWESSRINEGFLNVDFSDPGDWLWYCASKYSDKELSVILYGARQIWFNRNLVVNGKGALSPYVEAATMLEVIQRSQKPENMFVVTSLVGDSCWKPPENDYIKINVDGAWDRDSRKAGLGLCCRDSAGVFLFVEAEPISYLGSSFEAELCSLHRSLVVAERMNLKMVIFELDSAEVFIAIQSRPSLIGRGAEWMSSSKHLLGKNSHWFLSLIPREANSVADKLAKKAKERAWLWRNRDAIPFGVL